MKKSGSRRTQSLLLVGLLLVLPSCDAGGSTADDAAPDSGVEVCTPGVPFPWSCGFENTCPDLAELAPEPYRPPKPPMEPGVTPRLLWADAERCPEFPYSNATPMAYMETDVDGEQREVVVMLMSGGSPNALNDVIQAISLNDANTGGMVACYPFPAADHNDAVGLVPVLSQLGRFFVVSSTESGESGLRPDTIVWSDGPGVDSALMKRYPTNDVQSVFMSGKDELILVLEHSFAALNPLNGEPYWVQDTGGERAVYGIERPDKTLQIKLFSGEQQPLVRSYDRCGVPTKEVVTGWTSLPIGNATVSTTQDREAVVVVDGSETVREPACVKQIQVNDKVVTCAHQNQKLDEYSLVSFDLAGTWRSEFPLTSEVIFYDNKGFVAGPDNIVVFSVPDPDVDLRFQTMAVDVVTNEVKWSLTFQGEEFRYSTGLLTPRGVLIMTRGAIQTDVFGLAPTYYPRGWVGGNENRGYVALPE